MTEPTLRTLPYDGRTLQLYEWLGEGRERLLLISHGLGENGLRFAHVAAFFNEAGYDVVAFDHQGHGRSSGGRGTIESTYSLVGETVAVLAASNHPRYRHRVLYAHSMGALLALKALRDRSFAMQLSAAVLSAPPLALAFEPPRALVAVAGLAAKLAPNVTKHHGLEVAALSRDTRVVDAYLADPLNHTRLSMRLANAFVTLPKELLAGPHDLRLPVLLIHGDADRICAVDGSRTYATLNASSGVVLREWPGGYHEMHNEPEQAEVLAFAKTFLDDHLR